MHVVRKGVSLLLALVVLLACGMTAQAVTNQGLDAAISNTAGYLLKTVKDPQVGSVGGEWAVLGLARSGYDVPDKYYQDYCSTVEAYVKACNGVLDDRKYTEYSRVILALTSIGKDPANVAGYNLLTPLGDYDKTIWQGINGPIFALIALDSGNYPMPQNPNAAKQATRDLYVNNILSQQLNDGGFALAGTAADPDITAMALQALAGYKGRADVNKVIGEAVSCLSNMQDDQGGYSSWGTGNSESVAQVITALGELGISLDDSRFVKNGNTLVDSLLTYYIKDNGFRHTADGSGSNGMATEQAFYALVSARRNMDGKNSLYDMSDALKVPDSGDTGSNPGEGLGDKNSDIKAMPIIYPGRTFPDISVHVNKSAIEALAARGIIDGKTGRSFDPDATMTRAEFAAIIVRGLGLTLKTNNNFTDVPPAEWYAGYVGTANAYGIVNGATTTTFNPLGAITRQEAAVMVARAAKLCGMDTSMGTAEIRDMLAQFADYVLVASWAQESVAFCCKKNILNQSDLEINPVNAIKRCEIAQMLFNMLGDANLL